MSDGLERRALLEQVGEALRAVTGKSGKGPGSLAVKAVAGHEDLALQVAQAYAAWPTMLLAETLDREALARSVVALFKGQQKGWAAYLKAVHKDVPGFGEGVIVEAEATPVEQATVTEKPAEPVKHSKAKAEKKAKHADEKVSKKKPDGKQEDGAKAEQATEGETPVAAGEPAAATASPFLSPSWPWKPGEGAPASGASISQ